MYNQQDAFLCVDCKKDTSDEYYRIHDELWAKAGMLPHGGMLCILCLEKRLGRKVVEADFIITIEEMNRRFALTNIKHPRDRGFN